MGLVSDRVILVTGASRGIGRGIAIALAAPGTTIFVTGRTTKTGTAPLPGTIGETAAEIDKRGGKGIAVACDHRDDAQVQSLFERIDKEAGHLDLLVNNVTLIPDELVMPGPFYEKPLAMQALLDVGLRSHYVASWHAARRMVPRRHGTVINVASQAGLVALPGESVYCMTKAAMIHMTRCLAVEWAPHQIRVNAVAPTFTRTDSTRRWLDDPVFLDSLLARIPLGRVGEPRNVADPIVFLASQAAAMITGATLAIDGGWTAV